MPSVDPNPWWWLPGALIGLGLLGALALAAFAVMMLAALAFELIQYPPDWWRRWRGK